MRWWCKRAKLGRLEPFRKLAKSIQKHWSGVVAFLKTRPINGAIEAVNGLLQLAKRLARGFRSLRYFRIMAYLKAAGLHLNLPSSSRPSLPTQNSEWPKFDSFPRRSRDNEHLSASRLSDKESVNERVDFEEGSPAAREIFENWVKRVTPGGPTEALCSRHFFDRMIPSLNLAQRFPPEL